MRLLDSEAILKMVERSRDCMAALANLFKESDIPATWALVGHLLLESCHRINGVAHADMPRPRLESGVDWYALDPCTSVDKAPLWYAPDLAGIILDNSIKHELASHSFSHVDFSKCSRHVALAEVRKSKALMKKFLDISPKTFVFPKSHVGYMDVLKSEGFTAYRGPIPETSLEKHLRSYSLFAYKITNLLKSKIGRRSPICQPKFEGLWNVSGSFLFQKSRWLSAQDLFNISVYSTKQAARKKGIFHIILHDYRLVHSDTCKAFCKLLAYVIRLRREHQITIMTIQSLVTKLSH